MKMKDIKPKESLKCPLSKEYFTFLFSAQWRWCKSTIGAWCKQYGRRKMKPIVGDTDDELY